MRRGRTARHRDQRPRAGARRFCADGAPLSVSSLLVVCHIAVFAAPRAWEIVVGQVRRSVGFRALSVPMYAAVAWWLHEGRVSGGCFHAYHACWCIVVSLRRCDGDVRLSPMLCVCERPIVVVCGTPRLALGAGCFMSIPAGGKCCALPCYRLPLVVAFDVAMPVGVAHVPKPPWRVVRHRCQRASYVWLHCMVAPAPEVFHGPVRQPHVFAMPIRDVYGHIWMYGELHVDLRFIRVLDAARRWFRVWRGSAVGGPLRGRLRRWWRGQEGGLGRSGHDVARAHQEHTLHTVSMCGAVSVQGGGRRHRRWPLRQGRCAGGAAGAGCVAGRVMRSAGSGATT